MDLALAQHLEAKLAKASGVRSNRRAGREPPEDSGQVNAHSASGPSRREGPTLEPRQWDVLLRVSRQVKEQMLADGGPEQDDRERAGERLEADRR